MRGLSYVDEARLEYGRLLWRNPAMRRRLLEHWTDPRHPYRDRFAVHREKVIGLLEAVGDGAALDAALRARGTSLREVAREIPPVFGSFW